MAQYPIKRMEEMPEVYIADCCLKVQRFGDQVLTPIHNFFPCLSMENSPLKRVARSSLFFPNAGTAEHMIGITMQTAVECQESPTHAIWYYMPVREDASQNQMALCLVFEEASEQIFFAGMTDYSAGGRNVYRATYLFVEWLTNQTGTKQHCAPQPLGAFDAFWSVANAI